MKRKVLIEKKENHVWTFFLEEDQIAEIEESFERADKAQREFEKWDQASIDRAIRSVAQIVYIDFSRIFNMAPLPAA